MSDAGDFGVCVASNYLTCTVLVHHHQCAHSIDLIRLYIRVLIIIITRYCKRRNDCEFLPEHVVRRMGCIRYILHLHIIQNDCLTYATYDVASQHTNTTHTCKVEQHTHTLSNQCAQMHPTTQVADAARSLPDKREVAEWWCAPTCLRLSPTERELAFQANQYRG